MPRYKDFFIDGDGYWIDGQAVPEKEFEQRRVKECSHRWGDRDTPANVCRDCGIKDKK